MKPKALLKQKAPQAQLATQGKELCKSLAPTTKRPQGTCTGSPFKSCFCKGEKVEGLLWILYHTCIIA